MKKVLFLLVTGLFISINSNSQTWIKDFGGNDDDRAYEVLELNDGNFLITGYASSYGSGGKDVSILKLDLNGNIIWSKVIGGIDDEVAYSAIQISSGEIFLAGYTKSYGNGEQDIYLIKLSEHGNLIWGKTFGGSNNDLCNAIKETLNGNLILIGKTNSSGYGQNDIYVLEIDMNGNLVWEKTYGFNKNDVGHDIEQLPDSTFIICGQSETIFNQWFVSRLNNNGDTIWQKTYDYGESGTYCNSSGYVGEAEATSVVLVNDSLFYLAGKGYNGSGFAWCTRWIVRKMDILGNTVWNNSPYNYSTKSLYAADLTHDKGVILVGLEDNAEDNVQISKLDSNGNTVFQRDYLIGVGYSFGYDVKVCNNGSIIFCGGTDLLNAGGFPNPFNMFVIKTDSEGLWSNNLNKISGSVELDAAYYLPNIGLDNQIIKFKDLHPDTSMWVADSFYTHTDENGDYSVFADTGSYEVSYIAHHPYYLTDPVSGKYQVNFPAYHLTENNINFYDSVIYQPHGIVNISSSIHRPCMSGYYQITYQNNGYLPMEGVQIVFEYNPNVIITNSVPPWSFIDSDSIVFYLDTLQPFETGSIIIHDSVVCETEITDNTVCAYASIYGSNITNTPGPSWDQSSVSVDGSCYIYESTDSVRFVIYNDGNDMLTSSEYRIYENNSLIIQNSFQLTAGDSLDIILFSVGHTYRLEADQHPDHPGNSHPRITIEDCGEFFGVPGLVYSVPYDDYAIDNAWVCNTLVNSYDPNCKEVYPSGISSENYISPETPYLNYYIHFQNTGTDVAYNVTIKDTISPFLDITTINIISSSHDYTWDLYGPGIVQFTFNNINLPDSNANEPESHGYINYKINLRDSLPDYTIVENEAYIFFDYNEAILTNTVFHTVHDTILAPVPYSIKYDTICGNDSIYLQYHWQKDSGIYYDTLSTINGDSLVATKLHVKTSFLDEEHQYICNGDSAFWRGNYYKNTGQFFESYSNIFSCDSTYILNLTVYPAYLNYENETICSNDSILFGGQYYNQSGIYYDSLVTVNGCDSVIELSLNINLALLYYISEDIEICKDDSAYWQGSYYDSTGTYSHNYTSTFGCDSIREMNLTVHQKYYDHIVLEVCQGDSIIWEGNYYSVFGNYSENFNSINNCDSIREMSLFVNPVQNSSIDFISICLGDSVNWQGNYYNSTGTYEITYQNMFGCDSTIKLYLDVLPNYHNNETFNICHSDSVLWQGGYYADSGTYLQLYSTINGCDSIFEMTLNILPNYNFIDSFTICSEDTLVWQGSDYFNAGVYYDSLFTFEGCDSIYKLILNTNETFYEYLEYQICDGDSIFWQNNYYSISGNYIDQLTSVSGCDSIKELGLIVNPNPIVDSIIGIDSVDIYQTELYYIVNDSLIYYWEVENGTILQQISGNVVQVQWDSLGTGHIYVVAENQYGCFSDTTIMNIIIGTTYLNKVCFKNKLLIFPNPTSGEFSIIVDGFIRAEIINNLGQKLFVSDKMKINASNLSSGIYYVKVLTDRGSIIGKILKK